MCKGQYKVSLHRSRQYSLFRAVHEHTHTVLCVGVCNGLSRVHVNVLTLFSLPAVLRRRVRGSWCPSRWGVAGERGPPCCPDRGTPGTGFPWVWSSHPHPSLDQPASELSPPVSGHGTAGLPSWLVGVWRRGRRSWGQRRSGSPGQESWKKEAVK